jgi:hypothetical protein
MLVSTILPYPQPRSTLAFGILQILFTTTIALQDGGTTLLVRMGVHGFRSHVLLRLGTRTAHGKASSLPQPFNINMQLFCLLPPLMHHNRQ